ncbi:MAG: hypothetical protein VXZ72_00540 [Chlamydiota bacterium]|nr:hypothetical protein [Chlamydiota bacterium]
MSLPGEKAKIINMLDHTMADELVTLYSIELALMKSPKKGTKCGAIVMFKLNNELEGVDWKKDADPREIFQAKKELSEQTDMMFRDPEYFKISEGRWIPWALTRVMELYDQVGGADVVIKCPKLKIRQKLTRKEVAAGRNDLKKLFWTAWDIDKLLDKNYKYDPWLQQIRRGKIGAEFIKSRK